MIETSKIWTETSWLYNLQIFKPSTLPIFGWQNQSKSKHFYCLSPKNIALISNWEIIDFLNKKIMTHYLNFCPGNDGFNSEPKFIAHSWTEEIYKFKCFELFMRFIPVVTSHSSTAHSFILPPMGCQIFLGTWDQNRKYCPKWTQNVPICHKISQLSVEFSKWP
jgi:hypothetical protein